jgi:hypothetical protein
MIWHKNLKDVDQIKVGDIIVYPFKGKYIATSKIQRRFIVTKLIDDNKFEVVSCSFTMIVYSIIVNFISVNLFRILMILRKFGFLVIDKSVRNDLIESKFKIKFVSGRKVKKLINFDIKDFLCKIDFDDLFNIKVEDILEVIDKLNTKQAKFIRSLVGTKYSDLSVRERIYFDEIFKRYIIKDVKQV